MDPSASITNISQFSDRSEVNAIFLAGVDVEHELALPKITMASSAKVIAIVNTLDLIVITPPSN